MEEIIEEFGRLEQEAKAAMEKATKLLPDGDFRKSLTAIRGQHIGDISRYASACQLSPVVQHLREIHEENVKVEGILDGLVNVKSISDNKVEEIAEATDAFGEAIEALVFSYLKHNCGCNLR